MGDAWRISPGEVIRIRVTPFAINASNCRCSYSRVVTSSPQRVVESTGSAWSRFSAAAVLFSVGQLNCMAIGGDHQYPFPRNKRAVSSASSPKDSSTVSVSSVSRIIALVIEVGCRWLVQRCYCCCSTPTTRSGYRPIPRFPLKTVGQARLQLSHCCPRDR